MAVSKQGGGKRRNSGEPAQHSSVKHRCAAHPKENPRCRFGGPKSAMELTDSEPTGMRRARTSPPPQYRDDPLLRFRGDRPVREPASIPNCNSIRASRPTAIAGPSLVSGRVFPRDPKESRSVLRSRVKELRPRAALTVDFLTSRRTGLLPALGKRVALVFTAAQLALRRRK